jgi:histidinol-phosphate aminotransferase
VLDLAARVFLAPGTSAVFSKHAFAVYPLATMSAGAECIAAPAKNYGHDRTPCWRGDPPDTRGLDRQPQQSDRQLPAQGRGARLHREDSRTDVAVVVLDEAYTEYLAPADRADTVAWIKDFPNLMVVRTFSKIYGLAGLRVGYGVAGAEVTDLLNRVRQPFNVNNLALAGARRAR